MGSEVLTAGIRVAVDFAKAVNAQAGKQQVTTIDMGGGLPVNYWGDEWAADKIPTFSEYADHLKQHIPELFSGEFKVLTEFGQSISAKCGFLASRVEWMKGTVERPIAIIHFGADCCPRQAYGTGHDRRFEAYRADTTKYPVDEDNVRETSVGGPLCFQGDFLAKKIQLPKQLQANDFLVMKDAGANTLSLFSRHCSRLCPAVYGYRWANGIVNGTISEIVELKPRETMAEVSNFWGPQGDVPLGTAAASREQELSTSNVRDRTPRRMRLGAPPCSKDVPDLDLEVSARISSHFSY